jgi:hypothetical protein
MNCESTSLHESASFANFYRETNCDSKGSYDVESPKVDRYKNKRTTKCSQFTRCFCCLYAEKTSSEAPEWDEWNSPCTRCIEVWKCAHKSRKYAMASQRALLACMQQLAKHGQQQGQVKRKITARNMHPSMASPARSRSSSQTPCRNGPSCLL